MIRRRHLVPLCLGAALGLSACGVPRAASAPPSSASISASTRATPDPSAPRPSLRAYRDEAELTLALERWRTASQALQASAPRVMFSGSKAVTGAVPMPAPLAMAAAPAATTAGNGPSAAESSARRDDDGITNVQTAGVDEGGIVKRAGDHLVVLRRGRLFTIKVGGDALAPVAQVDAYAPGSNPQGAWYDELLVSGRTVVVVGYSHQRGGTEIGLFDLGTDGSLTYRATHHLRSFDYYAARNYASRLVGKTLVFYSPTLLQPDQPPLPMFPGWRRWRNAPTPPEFERILPATRIYRTDDELAPGEPLALHTVTQCDLDGADLGCRSSAVLGPAGRVFHVSAGSVYVWTTAPRRRAAATPPDAARPAPAEPPRSAVFRLPLDGTAPTALKTAGAPIDQMSFLEDASGHLNVLLREGGGGESMFDGERAAGGELALLRVPLAAFGDGSTAARRQHYQRLPAAPRGALQNRYIGDWLLWGAASGGGNDPRDTNGTNGNPPTAWALRYASAAEPLALRTDHAVERIEALGNDAVLVGNRGAELSFSAFTLGREPRLASTFRREGARQGETRTHGFFYRPMAPDEGLLGLPVLAAARGRAGPATAPSPAVYRGDRGSASVLYLRWRQQAFRPLGELASADGPALPDQCKASCVDWYGNARPIFIGERVFALLGYELVEGQLADDVDRVQERRRISFAPAAALRPGERYSPFTE